jgi:hypothetical protein
MSKLPDEIFEAIFVQAIEHVGDATARALAPSDTYSQTLWSRAGDWCASSQSPGRGCVGIGRRARVVLIFLGSLRV